MYALHTASSLLRGPRVVVGETQHNRECKSCMCENERGYSQAQGGCVFTSVGRGGGSGMGVCTSVHSL